MLFLILEVVHMINRQAERVVEAVERGKALGMNEEDKPVEPQEGCTVPY